MDSLIIIAFVVVFTLAIAFSLYSRRRDRLVSPHTTEDASAPQAERRPSQPDHDHTDDAPMQHGTR